MQDDQDINDALAELAERRRRKLASRTELERRAAEGHSASCSCQSRDPDTGRPWPCKELRQHVGWKVVKEIFGE